LFASALRFAVHLGLELVEKQLDQLRRQQAVAEAGQHPVFDLLAADAAVIAGALRPPCRAAIYVLADNGIAATAAPAAQQAAEQKLAPVCTIERIAGFIAAHLDPDDPLACFNSVPKVVVDDPEMRNVDALPLTGRVGPGHPFAGAWVF